LPCENSDANAEGNGKQVVVVSPRLKEIVLSNVEPPMSAKEVMEMMSSRERHGAPLRDVLVEGAENAGILAGLPRGEHAKMGVRHEVLPVVSGDHPGGVSKDNGLDEEMISQ
jgi:hypothetical protein